MGLKQVRVDLGVIAVEYQSARNQQVSGLLICLEYVGD